MRVRADLGEGNISGHIKGEGEERENEREQWRECLRSGCSRRGGGNDRDRVVEAGVGLTGHCSLTTAHTESWSQSSSSSESTPTNNREHMGLE